MPNVIIIYFIIRILKYLANREKMKNERHPEENKLEINLIDKIEVVYKKLKANRVKNKYNPLKKIK